MSRDMHTVNDASKATQTTADGVYRYEATLTYTVRV